MSGHGASTPVDVRRRLERDRGGREQNPGRNRERQRHRHRLVQVLQERKVFNNARTSMEGSSASILVNKAEWLL